nr:beta-propeller domain-containing protein [Acholeplasmatales bacterium]
MKYNKFKKELKKEFNENYTEEKKSAKLKTNLFAFLIPGLVVLAFAVIITVIVSLEMPKKVEAEQLNEKRAYYENLIDEKISSYESGQYYEMKKCDETTFNDYNKLQATLWTESNYSRGSWWSSQPVAVDPIAGDVDIAPDTALEPETFYSTNNQEENVDEADIAKFDGKYCYYVTHYQFIIYDLNGNALVRDDSRDYYNLQLYNDKIILYYHCDSLRYDYYESKGVIYSFDGNSLKLLKEFYGDASASRIYNNCLYNVGAINVDSRHYENVYYSSLDIDFNNFYYDELSDIVSVIKLSKIKLDDLSEKAVYTACSYGGYHNLYMSEEGIVIPTTIYSLYDKNNSYSGKEMTLNMVFDTNLNPV